MAGRREIDSNYRTWLIWSTVMPFLSTFFFVRLTTPLTTMQVLVCATASGLVAGPGFTTLFLVAGPKFRRLPLLLCLLAWLVSFSLLLFLGFFFGILATMAVGQGVSMFDPRVLREVWLTFEHPIVRQGMLVAVGFLFFFIVVSHISRKLGPGVLVNWLLGRYYRPHAEELIFMFLDMKDSTTLAERLGDHKFSELVQEFFRDLGRPLAETKGRVSHYIGDEAVITWRLKDGLKKGRCLEMFYLFGKEIESRREVYQRRFGVVPGFKAGLHIGSVVAAEVGDMKSEIVYHGDTVNTAARIQGLCAEYDEDLLISTDLQEAIEDGSRFEFQPLGERQVKGRVQPIGLAAVRRKS